MSKEDSYFQFPLPLLAYETDIEKRLLGIVDYCLVDTGRKLIAKMDEDSAGRMLNEFDAASLPAGYKCGVPDHRAVVVGMAKLNVMAGSVPATLERHGACSKFIKDWEGKYNGRHPDVRIKTKYLWEVRDGAGMTYREFQFLCAVYCIIGGKEYPVLITRTRIMAAAFGHKSPKTLPRKIPITTDQLRYTLDTLEAQGHFARCQASKRKVYFSHRLTRDQMREKLFSWKTKRNFQLRKERDADRILQDRIKSTNIANGRLNSPPSPHYNSENDGSGASPSSPQITPTESPPSPRAVPTIIQTPLIETSFTETAFIQTKDITSGKPDGAISLADSTAEIWNPERFKREAVTAIESGGRQ
jgi:hypothetical protein